MPRRRIVFKKLSFSAITAYLLLFPFSLASLQQEPQDDQNSPREHGSVTDPAPPIGDAQKRLDAELFDTTYHKHLKKISVDSDRASAIATLAPAFDKAVRAPRSARGECLLQDLISEPPWLTSSLRRIQQRCWTIVAA
jgi:hypothetical protein